jgi:hypothetical protein
MSPFQGDTIKITVLWETEWANDVNFCKLVIVQTSI